MPPSNPIGHFPRLPWLHALVEADGTFSSENLRWVFLRFAIHGSIWAGLPLAALVLSIYFGWILPELKSTISVLDAWQMGALALTWVPLGAYLLRRIRKIPLRRIGMIVVIYWSLLITVFTRPVDLANGTVVIYFALTLITAGLYLPAWTSLALSGLYVAVTIGAAEIARVPVRIFDLAGLVMTGIFCAFLGGLLDASYRALHDLNQTLESRIRKRTSELERSGRQLFEINRSLEEENQRRAVLETELRVAMASAEKATQLKSQFLANVSHEIRTPLTSIIGFTHLLQETPLDPDQRGYLETVLHSSEMLLALLNDVLDISKIEARQLKLESLVFDLPELIAGVIAVAGEGLRGKPIALTVEYAADLPRWFRGDPTRLRQILFNLVGNAVKFTAQGSVTIRAAGGAPVLKEKTVWWPLELSVQDTGIGISAEHHRDIFEAFVQADGSVTRRFGGTGLGLAITRELVDLMGGSLELESEDGRGSLFRVRLSLSEERCPEPETPPAPAVVPGRTTASVLIVEDNAVNRTLLTALLGKQGLQTATAANGREALERLAVGPFDLVLMDLQMPEMDGLEAAREIRRRGLKVPILALTAHALKEDMADCAAAGMNDYLAKPIDPAQLKRKLHAWLSPDSGPSRPKEV